MRGKQSGNNECSKYLNCCCSCFLLFAFAGRAADFARLVPIVVAICRKEHYIVTVLNYDLNVWMIAFSADMKSSESSSPSLKVRDRYRSHRLSYWLNLIPRLQVHGKEESENFKRHLQDQRNFNGGKNLNEVAFFEKISLQFRDNLKPASSSSPSSSTGTLHHSPDSSSDQRTLSSIASVAAAAGASDPPSSSSARSKSLSSSDASTSNHNGGSGSGSNHSITSSSSSSSPSSSKSGKATTIILHPESDYSNLLTTTLGVGLTLLALNILAFSAVYYKFNKGKHQQQQQQQHPNGRHRRTGSSMSGTNPSAQGLGMAAPRRTSSVASKKGSLPRSSPHHHHHHQHHQQQQQQQIQQHTRSPAHLLSQQQQQLHSDAADHLLNHHHLESMVQQQQHDLLPGSYQISFTDSEYGSEAGFNDKHDLHSIYHQQQQQQQQHHVHPHSRHATVTFNDYISNQSSHAGTTATAQQQHQQQSLCVKYSASPSSLLMDEDGNVLTTAPLSDDCCHQLLSQPDIGHRMSPAAASIMDYGYTNGSQSNGIAVSSASSSVNPAPCSSRVCTITGNQGPVVVPVNPCDVNCLTVIQELDDDEHMWMPADVKMERRDRRGILRRSSHLSCCPSSRHPFPSDPEELDKRKTALVHLFCFLASSRNISISSALLPFTTSHVPISFFVLLFLICFALSITKSCNSMRSFSLPFLLLAFTPVYRNVESSFILHASDSTREKEEKNPLFRIIMSQAFERREKHS